MPRPRADGEWRIRKRRGRRNLQAHRRIEGRDEWVSLKTDDEVTAGQALVDLKHLESARVPVTVAEMLDVYLDDRHGKVMAYRRLKEAVVPLKAKLGHLRLDQINQRVFDGYARDRGVSAGTLRRERNVLIAGFNLMRAREVLASAPTIKPPPMPAPVDRYLTRDEARRLLDAFASPHARLLYTILLLTGCRKGAALGLTWDRVDFANNRIDFNDPNRPVTKKRRGVVPMGEKLLAAMREAAAIRTTDYVIEWSGKHASRVRHPFTRARIRAGLGPDVTPHVLRHTAASWLAMSRVPKEEAADLLACDMKTLDRVYRKFDPSYLRPAVDALEAYL